MKIVGKSRKKATEGWAITAVWTHILLRKQPQLFNVQTGIIMIVIDDRKKKKATSHVYKKQFKDSASIYIGNLEIPKAVTTRRHAPYYFYSLYE
jgi:hypothetical protein